MPSGPVQVLFSVVVVAVVVSVHFYLGRRLVEALRLEGRRRRIALIAALALGVALPAIGGLGWLRPYGVFRFLGFAIYAWAVVALYALLLTAAFDLFRAIRAGVRAVAGRLGRAAEGAAPAVDEAKRATLGKIAAAGVGIAAAGTAAAGLASAAADPDVTDVEIPLRGLGPGPGLTIAHLSDLHIGPFMDGERVRRVVEIANALRPDIVVMTGDVIDRYAGDVERAFVEFSRLRAPLGAFACAGNHEFWGDVDLVAGWLARNGVTMLRNRRATVDTPHGPLDVVGVDDHWAGRRTPDGGPRLDLAVAGRDPSRPAVLMCHQPRDLEKAEAAGIGLQLSGHLHGGQIFPIGLLQRFDYEYLAGLYGLGRTRIYVSRGIGTVGPPARVGAAPEIVRVRLVQDGG